MSYYNNPFESGEFMKTAGYGQTLGRLAGTGLVTTGAGLVALKQGPRLIGNILKAPLQLGGKILSTAAKPGGVSGMIQGAKDTLTYGGPAALLAGGYLLHRSAQKAAPVARGTLFGNLNPMTQGAILGLGGAGLGALGLGLYNKYKKNNNTQYNYDYQYYPKYGSFIKTAGMNINQIRGLMPNLQNLSLGELRNMNSSLSTLIAENGKKVIPEVSSKVVNAVNDITKSPGFLEGRNLMRGTGLKAIGLGLVPAAVAAAAHPIKTYRAIRDSGVNAYNSVRKFINPNWVSAAERNRTLADRASSLVGRMSDWEKAITAGSIGLGGAGLGALAYDTYDRRRNNEPIY